MAEGTTRRAPRVPPGQNSLAAAAANGPTNDMPAILTRHVVIAALRDFLDIGGRVMVAPDGRLHHACGWPAPRGVVISEAAETVAYSAVATLTRLLRRDTSRRMIERVVRSLGNPDSGWIVLGRKGA